MTRKGDGRRADDDPLADTALPSEANADRDPALAMTAPSPPAPVAPLEYTVTDAETPRARVIRDSGLIGRRLAHYQLEVEIGRGGMGVVYRARDLSLDRPVAIKVVSDEFAGPADHRARFYREARAQAGINHPNVCHIYFVGEDAGQLFFAMELVDGDSVSDLLEREGKVPAPRALEIVRQACLGLREAQRRGIVHRDVKPANLMIDRHGVVKVMDFGIAKQAEQLGDDAPLSTAPETSIEQTSIAGTPLYAAPEQLMGKAVDHRSDIYALGATLHKLLSGAAPFVADSADELTEMHKSKSRPAYERQVIGQRDLLLLDELTDRMMAKLPADRFASYDDLLTSIEFAEPSASRPAGFGIRAASVAIDLLVVSVLTAVVGLALPFLDGNLIFAGFGLAYGVVFLGRFGATLGRWLLGIEVTSKAARRGLGFRTAAIRCLWEFGPILFLIGVFSIIDQTNAGWLNIVGAAGIGVSAFVNVVHVAVVSLRSRSARTFWDNRAGTQVRYLRVPSAQVNR